MAQHVLRPIVDICLLGGFIHYDLQAGALWKNGAGLFLIRLKPCVEIVCHLDKFPAVIL